MDATHVVIRITYGHCVCVSFEHRLEKNEDKNEIEAKLRIEMTKILPNSNCNEGSAVPTNPIRADLVIPDALGFASGSIGATFDRASNVAVDLFNINIYADFNLEDSLNLPQNVDEAMAFFKKLPQFLKNVEANNQSNIFYILLMF